MKFLTLRIYRHFVILMLACFFAFSVEAQFEFSISPTPVGSGARAAGMADAFGAVADDATAASWNPAGLVQLERPEFSIVGEWNSVTDHFSAALPNPNRGEHDLSTTNLNFASFTYPLPMLLAGRNSVVSITYQNRFDLTRAFDANLHTSLPDFGIESDLNFDFDQDGALGVISPAYAIELTHNLSIGVAVNFWRSSFFSENSWDQTVTVDTSTTFDGGTPDTTHQVTLDEYEDFKGENFTAGLLWNVAPKWNLSLRYDSGFTGDIDFKKTITQFDSNLGDLPTQTFAFDQEMSMPDTIGFGVAYRRNDRLTLALHVSRTDWNDFYLEDPTGKKTSLVDGTDLSNPDTYTHFDPTHSVRFGAEYVFIPKNTDSELKYLWSLRGGLIYDEEPASDRSTFDPNSSGHGTPDRFYGYALGVGLQAFRRVNVDLAYQYRRGDDVKSDRVRGLPGFSEDYRQHRVILSSIIYF